MGIQTGGGGGGLSKTHRPSIMMSCSDFSSSEGEFSDMSGQVKVWRGKRVLVGDEVMAATVVVQGNTIKNVLPGVVDVPG